MQSFIVDDKNLPVNWPTHKGSQAFWEELGRTVASFGFLKDTLARTNFALTASRERKEITKQEYQEWLKSLELSLTEALGQLINRIKEVFKDDNRISQDYGDNIVRRLEELKVYRNALCHGAWISFYATGNSAKLRYFRRTGGGGVEVLDNCLSQTEIANIRKETVEVTKYLMNIVTSNGIQFPGSASPSVALWKTDVL